MRLLFGDSTPFPLDFDFLATLESFMSTATRVVLLEHKSKQQELTFQRDEEARQTGVVTVNQLHERLLRALERSAEEVHHPAAREYASRIGELAKRIQGEQISKARELKERELEKIAQDAAQRMAEVQAHFGHFFTTATLFSMGSQIMLELRDGKNAVSAVVAYPDRISASFVLEPSAAFLHPVRVSDFATDVHLKVGIKKSFFKGVVSAESMALDDWYFGAFEVQETRARLALRKKPDQRDALVFHLHKNEQGFAGQVEHPGDPNAAAVPSALDPEDFAAAERLWSAVKSASAPLLDQKNTIISLTLDGADVFAKKLALPLVARLVRMFAPLTTEIARLSSSEQELSLKVEAENGRREEIYLRRSDISSKLDALPAEGRAVFSPLGLDTWVPHATMAPPSVGIDDETTQDVPPPAPSFPRPPRSGPGGTTPPP